LGIERQQERIDLTPLRIAWAGRFLGLGLALAIATHGHVTLQDLQVELAVIEHGAGAKGPEESERADIFLPQLFAGDIERRQVAVAVEEDNQLSIGCRRGRGKRAARVFANALGDVVLPNDLSRT